MKESSFLHRETSVDEVDDESRGKAEGISPPPAREGVPIRWQH